MPTMSEESLGFSLTLTEKERSQLSLLLEQVLRDTHVEARRTENPQYQQQVHDQEAVLRSLIEKLRRT